MVKVYGNNWFESNWIQTEEAIVMAQVFAIFSILISSYHITSHLRHYTMPQIQIYVIRILITCPVYAVTSSLAITMGTYGTYAEILRDVYEAFVTYSFLSLILEYAGGETDCLYQIENEPVLRLPFPLCCLPPRARDARLMRFTRRGVLQFVVTKPLVALLNVIMLLTGLYNNSAWVITELIIYNISYAWALYCLFVFYLATEKIIKQFRPVAKFATIKSIIFATYYQSMFLKLALDDPDQAILWNDFLLCLEMVFFSIALMFAFPVKEFKGGVPDRRMLQNVKDVLTVRDIYQDVYHNFMPAYGDYALQRSVTEGPTSHSNLPTNLSVNLAPVALEMAERYRGKGSKRLAFNSLLRGSRPITAKLRTKYEELPISNPINTSFVEECADVTTVFTTKKSNNHSNLSFESVVTEEMDMNSESSEEYKTTENEQTEVVITQSNNQTQEIEGVTTQQNSEITQENSVNGLNEGDIDIEIGKEGKHEENEEINITTGEGVSPQDKNMIEQQNKHLGRLTLSVKHTPINNNSTPSLNSYPRCTSPLSISNQVNIGNNSITNSGSLANLSLPPPPKSSFSQQNWANFEDDFSPCSTILSSVPLMNKSNDKNELEEANTMVEKELENREIDDNDSEISRKLVRIESDNNININISRQTSYEWGDFA